MPLNLTDHKISVTSGHQLAKFRLFDTFRNRRIIFVVRLLTVKLRSLMLVFIATLYSIALVADDNHHHGAGEKLGTVNFPTSCKADTQKPFERGLALLYSFEYPEAEQQFKEVSRQDPQCGMAYWGQAMSLYHQLW